ncbi:MAG: Acetyl-/propionyl-coenzyme A carboxylase alpha chain [Burkholderiaceae bacterium]|nr:Acetyl-/propionyl-coenzyme A carboxylase alpha chain [Burkholderiaceae bacterium]
MTPLATPFSKLLVANRGEIALRVMRSARELGYRTVAVYSTADAGSLHVREADQAVCIGEPAPAQSYLNIAAIVEAARKTGADAVHPGYGFLAESAAFARVCRDAGLVFVGPPPEAIAAMGDKAAAKRLMLAAGVPCVPGYDGDDRSAQRLAAEAQRIGWPLMIKAVAGGGGRGMRLVAAPEEFADALRSAQSEAQHAFGDDAVLLERAIPEPRHIEIQVLADRHGHAIHLGERDCSVQRRHQKLIEESPSPAVSDELRERMGAAAVAAAKSIGYEGAGTLEFLLDAEGRYYFMEMNTRLQVEHPVTEAITGLDLVALQLRIAAGEPLPLRQADVRRHGHAIEVRLCAEDAAADFMPQSGTLGVWQPTPRLRVEHALQSGSEITPHYDSMIAKLIAHGATRDEARRRLIAGLADTVALGVTTNQALLLRCLAHPVFAAGDATTAFIAQHGATLLPPADEPRTLALAAALLHATSPGARLDAGSALSSPALSIAARFEVDGRAHAATLVRLGGRRLEVTLGSRRHEIEVVALDGHHARIACDGVLEHAAWWRDGDRLWLAREGVSIDVLDTTRDAALRHAGAAGDGALRASMIGRVVAVLVSVGDRVRAGQPVLTLEAMKMEHVHAAPTDGVVKALHVGAGDQVAARSLVAEIVAALPASDAAVPSRSEESPP